MSNSPRHAWLITWDNYGCDPSDGLAVRQSNHPVILPPWMTKKCVEKLVIALWAAEADIYDCDRILFALDKKQSAACFHGHDGQHFYFGLKPLYLYARKVTHLRSSECGGLYTLHWRETEIVGIDLATGKGRILRDACEAQWTRISSESNTSSAIVSPAGSTGANVTMECSTNLVDWMTATNGFYSATNVSTFFRIKADRVP